MAKKAKAAKRGTDRKKYIDALRENTAALKRNTELLEKLLASGGGPTTSTFSATVFDATLSPALKSLSLSKNLFKAQIKQRLAAAMNRPVDSLVDSHLFSASFAGGSGVADIVMSNINQAFWPGTFNPKVTFDELKSKTIAEVVTIIRSRL